MDYDPLPAVKRFTLDAKVKEEMDGPEAAEKAVLVDPKSAKAIE